MPSSGVYPPEYLQTGALLYPCSRATGLQFVQLGLKSSPNTTRSTYRSIMGQRAELMKMKAGATPQQIAQAVCRKDDLTDPACADALLLGLTPSAYSSNSTADTPGRRAFISPAQVGSSLLGDTGHAATAAGQTVCPGSASLLRAIAHCWV
jgi:hypothetical protein